MFQRIFYNPHVNKRGSVADPIYYTHFHPHLDGNHQSVGADQGSRIDAVFIALNTIAKEVASTDIELKKDTSNGQIRHNSSIQRLLSVRPNRKMSAFNWMYQTVWNYLAWGNAYSLIVRDGNQVPSELIPLDSYNVKVYEDSGELFYTYKNGDRIPSRDMLHFKMYTKDGVIGISPIVHNASLMGSKMSQQQYSNNSLGKKPPLVFSGDVTGEQMDALTDSFTQRFADNKIPYINGDDVKMHSLTIPPNEAQYIETSKYTDQKIYGIYNLPPTFAQDYDQGIKSNAEQQALMLVKHTLIPHYNLIEQECNEKLLTERNKTAAEPLLIDFNPWSKLRGDLVTLSKVANEQVVSGNMNADEVRKKFFNMPNQEGGIGQKFYIQGAMIEKGKEPPQEQIPQSNEE